MCLSIVKGLNTLTGEITARILHEFDHVVYLQSGMFQIGEYLISLINYAGIPNVSLYHGGVNFLTIEHITDVDKIISIIKAAIS